MCAEIPRVRNHLVEFKAAVLICALLIKSGFLRETKNWTKNIILAKKPVHGRFLEKNLT